MAGWKTVKHNLDGCGAKAQPLKDSDMAARRLLAGMGLLERQLKDRERELFSATFFEESQWSRAVRIWDNTKVIGQWQRLTFVDAAETPLNPKFFNEVAVKWKTTAYAYRSNDAAECYVCFAMNPADVGQLLPPFTVHGLSPDQTQMLVTMKLAQFALYTMR